MPQIPIRGVRVEVLEVVLDEPGRLTTHPTRSRRPDESPHRHVPSRWARRDG